MISTSRRTALGGHLLTLLQKGSWYQILIRLSGRLLTKQEVGKNLRNAGEALWKSAAELVFRVKVMTFSNSR